MVPGGARHAGRVVCDSGDGKFVAFTLPNKKMSENKIYGTVGKESAVEVKGIESSFPFSKILPTHWYQPTALAFSSDDRYLAVAGGYSRRAIYDMETGGQLWEGLLQRSKRVYFRAQTITVGRAARPVNSIAFSPTGAFFAVAVEDGSVEFWTVSNGKSIVKTAHQKALISLSFTAGGQHLATGSRDARIALWDTSKLPAASYRMLQGHSGAVTAVAFSPDAKQLASGSEDRSIILWNSQLAQKLIVLPGHQSYVNSVAFSQDGKSLVSASSDGSVKLWNLFPLQSLLELSDKIGALRDQISFDQYGTGIAPRSELSEILKQVQQVTQPLNSKECLTFLHSSQCPEMLGKLSDNVCATCPTSSNRLLIDGPDATRAISSRPSFCANNGAVHRKQTEASRCGE